MRVLVLGGIRSGKSRFAESLLADGGPVTYVATATASDDDREWADRIAAHRQRRGPDWTTEELGGEPVRVPALIAEAKPDESILVDDLGNWYAAILEHGDAAGALAAAVRDTGCDRLVLVSPEVGLSVVPASELGRRFADGIGELNRALADECDDVVLVVAGRPVWLKGGPDAEAQGALLPSRPARRRSTGEAPVGVRASVAPGLRDPDSAPTLQAPLDLPMPDENAAEAAERRLATLDVSGTGFGSLASVIKFAGGTQRTELPEPWRDIRVLLVHSDHEGGVAAGDRPEESARRVAQAEDGEGTLALLAAAAGASVEVVHCVGRTEAIETEDAMDEAATDLALWHGWQLAEAAVDSGCDLLVLASEGAGAEATAVAVTVLATGGETPTLLARVAAPGGRYDDEAWMARCVAVRDAVYRVRYRTRDPRNMLAMLGGPDLAVATGALLGAVSRQTPVVVDGPVGIAAALVAREFGAQTRHWLLLPDVGGDPAVRYGADILGLKPVLDLRLGLGEGTSALAALPLLNSALALVTGLGEHPLTVESTVDEA
jgi:adenosyl cobinamide kinase/adenosyl cobinamide phosphate guanylyltransferase/NaMN:DMB phosphoribosyltransferase